MYVLIQHFDKTDFLGDVTEEVKEQLKIDTFSVRAWPVQNNKDVSIFLKI